MVKAILFDMDGTLIDTEKYYTVFKQQAAREAGYHMDLKLVYDLRSKASQFASVQVKEIYGEDFDYDAFTRRRKELMKEHIEKYGLELKPYVRETVEELRRRGYRTAVVTATSEDRAMEYLKLTGLEELFDEIVCASMVKNGKPYPDVYLYACDKIGLKPEECIAVEDSPNGVTSAWKAGCQVVMVPDLTRPDERTAALTEYIVPGVKDILKIVS